jgi:hypothetical protein
MPAKVVMRKIVIELPERLHKLLRSAADRRHLSVDATAMQIVGGVVAKGSVDAALNRWGDYTTSTRVLPPSRKAKIDALKSEAPDENSAEV